MSNTMKVYEVTNISEENSTAQLFVTREAGINYAKRIASDYKEFDVEVDDHGNIYSWVTRMRKGADVNACIMVIKEVSVWEY